MSKSELEKESTAIDVLARTAWGEARDQGDDGLFAVMCVVINRANHPGWWGNDITSVCLKDKQFSCWNKDDPNREPALSVNRGDKEFSVALDKAIYITSFTKDVFESQIDITNGANHYHAVGHDAYWAAGKTPVAKIGNHIFYKL